MLHFCAGCLLITAFPTEDVVIDRIETDASATGQTATPDVPAPSAQISSEGGEKAAPVQAIPPSGDESISSPIAGSQVSPDETGLATSTAEPEIVVTARKRLPSDPLQSVNIVSFRLTQQVDDAITGPAARLYVRVTPKPLRVGFRHFLNNLREPVVFTNFLLQHKFGKAAETVGRFAINSTIGIAGVVDVAQRCPFNLPWRPIGFSDTLGFYGVKPGPFIFIPLAGPTTVRDFAGGFVDRLAMPFAIGGVFRSRPYLVTTNVYRLLDRRAEQEEELQAVRNSADPYVARRELYLGKRQDRIDSLRHPPSAPEAGTAAPEATGQYSTTGRALPSCRKAPRASSARPRQPEPVTTGTTAAAQREQPVP